MRLFTAIDLPADVRDRLASLIDTLRPLAPLRWSAPENLHITTKFIGDWPETQLAAIERALATVPPQPVAIAIRGLGWFPSTGQPRVLWAGIDAGAPLRNLARDTERAVAKLGVTVEMREYSPHLTLARIPDPDVLAPVRSAIEPLGSPEFGAFQATAFHLFSSTEGKYTRLAEYPL